MFQKQAGALAVILDWGGGVTGEESRLVRLYTHEAGQWPESSAREGMFVDEKVLRTQRC